MFVKGVTIILKEKLLRKINLEILFIFIISFCFAVFANLANIHVTHLMYGSNDGVLYGSTLSSPDNAWYLNQIKNYLNGFGFTIDPLDPIYAVRRTPGYPLFYGLHYILFGESGAHKVIPYTQTFLHALAAVYFFKTSKLLFSNSKVAFLSALLYGLSPFIVSFLFMTITESLFPAMIVFALYFAVSAHVKKSLLRCMYAGIMMAVVALISPRNILLLLFLLPLAFYYKNLATAQIVKLNLVFITAFIITMSPWTIRNYFVFGKFVPLETYHLNHTMEDQNIKLIALTRWWSTWGSPDKDRLHGEFARDIGTATPYKSIDAFINNEVPGWVYKVESKSYLRGLLIDYHNCMLRSIQLNGGRRLRYPEMPDVYEYKVAAGFDKYSDKIVSQYPFHALVVAPLIIRGKEYIFHSAIHNWSSFDDYRTHPIKAFLKGLAYAINIFLWLFSIAYLMSSRLIYEKILLGIVPIVSFVFLVYSRHVEGRYLIQIYPFLYLMSTLFIIETLTPALHNVLSRFYMESRSE